jgi:23S rRNA pseudouridine955/2504/2580 synthase|tara:strand:- start:1076 stop:2050 length:975 start_codon:yes stop_codon:yes gene_type:complete
MRAKSSQAVPMSTESQFSQVSYVDIGPEQAGQRLDNFLIKTLKGVPKSRIYRLLRKGEVRVNKGRVKAVTRLKEGDIVRLPPIRVAERGEMPAVGRPLSQYLADNVLFEDEGLLIINKPSGLAVHGGSGVSLGAIEALRAEHPELRFLELVHRLDRDTSGCLMLAKKRSVLLALQQDLQNNHIEKRYTALSKGRWPKGKNTINAPLRKNTLLSGERMVRVDVTGKASVTHFKILKQYPSATLLDIKLETGRTHQIRVHCEFAGQPIAGDPKYGDEEFNESMKPLGLKRLFLHARYLRFKHPLSDDWVEVEAPLPADLDKVLGKL